MKEYWNSLLTEKSWQILQDLKRKYDFILIGGWAVYLFTKGQKSKDIDIVVGISELEKLKEKSLSKNDNLNKYEIKKEEIDIDIYVEHYSKLAIPTEEIKNYIANIEGFKVAKTEALILLKQAAYENRKDSIKGEKDKIDIISLALLPDIDLGFYIKTAKLYKLENYIDDLKKIIIEFKDFQALDLTSQELKKKKVEFISKWRKISAK